MAASSAKVFIGAQTSSPQASSALSVEEIRKSINAHSVVQLCDKGISNHVYSHIFKEGLLREVLPRPFTVLKARLEEDRELLRFEPQFTIDGVELDPAKLLAVLMDLWPEIVNWQLSWDAHKLSQGNLSSQRCLTAVHLLPKGVTTTQSVDNVYRLVIYEGPDKRHYLRRNTGRLRAFLKEAHEAAEKDGKVGMAKVKTSNGTPRYIRILAVCDMATMWEVFPGWCFLCSCHEGDGETLVMQLWVEKNLQEGLPRRQRDA